MIIGGKAEDGKKTYPTQELTSGFVLQTSVIKMKFTDTKVAAMIPIE